VEILAHFRGWELSADMRWYLGYNVRRFEVLLERVDDALRNGGGMPDGQGVRLLDIGPGFQTQLLRDSHPGLTVDTLGFEHASFPARAGERHVHFDLNDAVHPERVPDPGAHEIAVMAEVIEHLYTPAAVVLRCIAGWVAPRGRLILQTPNAVALHKRLRMLVGRHPYGPLSESRTNPMHYREYTVDEIGDAAREAGFRVVDLSTQNYFDPGGAASTVYTQLGPVLPRRLRHGITALLERA
jgi:hypothetical protein